MSTKIEYNGAVIATVEGGNVATIPCRNKKMASDLVITIPEAGDSAIPTEVSTEAEMTALLENGEDGGVYKYTGETTETYQKNALYIFEAVDELRGTWEINTGGPIDWTFFRNPYTFNFSSGTGTFNSIRWVRGEGTYYDNVLVWVAPNFTDLAYATLVIHSKLAEVENGETLLSFLQQYATKQ